MSQRPTASATAPFSVEQRGLGLTGTSLRGAAFQQLGSVNRHRCVDAGQHRGTTEIARIDEASTRIAIELRELAENRY